MQGVIGNMSDADVTIVGAGFTGSALAIHLQQTLPASSRIVLIDEAAAIGRGLAYSTTNPVHLLNVVAGRMSLFPATPDDFVTWLVEHRLAELGTTNRSEISHAFVPRMWYGAYLSDRLDHAFAHGASGPHLTIVPGRAQAMDPLDDQWRITLANGDAFDSRAVVLCTGNQRSTLPRLSQPIPSEASTAVLHDPWDDVRLSQIDSRDDILIVGTGLTMVDQVLAREAAGHQGATIAVSRHGLLPNVHATPPLPHASLEGVREASSLPDLVRIVRAQAAGCDWRQTIDGLRPHTQEIWQGFSLDDRQRFLRHVATYWGVLRHRMAPQVAETVDRAQRAGRLRIVSGHLTRISRAAGRIRVDVLGRGDRGPSAHEVDWVLNCRGPERDPRRSTNPLLHYLLSHDLGKVDALQLGLDTTFQHEVVAASGRAWGNLFALGPVAMGSRWEIVAVPDLRVQCQSLAETLAASLTAQRPPAHAGRRVVHHPAA